MKLYLLPIIFILSSCENSSDKLVREHLDKSMNIPASNLEVVKIEFGDEVFSTPEQKKTLMLFGLKDTHGFPITVTFKAKAKCVVIAEAIKNDVLFKEKKISCRSVKIGETPNLKYIHSYKDMGFKQIPMYENGKLIKAGETFSARGELVHMTTLKDEKKSGTMFLALK
jgi:hypothetical protein